MTKRKCLICITCSILLISIVVLFCIIRENKLRRAFLGVEGLTFDTMNFRRIDDCKDFNELSRTDNIICKTTNGDWIIWSVEGYEESLEYVYANCFMDGYYYKKISD